MLHKGKAIKYIEINSLKSSSKMPYIRTYKESSFLWLDPVLTK